MGPINLDNTLYDWVAYFVPAFYAMVDQAVQIIGCDPEILLDDLRIIHQHHHNSEHPFALMETATFKQWAEGREQLAAEKIDPAFYAFNSTRNSTLRLYDDVAVTLEQIHRSGIQLVAHTDSTIYALVDRMRRLKIEHLFKGMFCRERPQSTHPSQITAKAWIGTFPVDRIVQLPMTAAKPNPLAISIIRKQFGSAPQDTFYVGDSVSKDIMMAKKAGIGAIWAKYGTQHDSRVYEKLVRISHWTQQDVLREMELNQQAANITPDFVCLKSFAEVAKFLPIPAMYNATLISTN